MRRRRAVTHGGAAAAARRSPPSSRGVPGSADRRKRRASMRGLFRWRRRSVWSPERPWRRRDGGGGPRRGGGDYRAAASSLRRISGEKGGQATAQLGVGGDLPGERRSGAAAAAASAARGEGEREGEECGCFLEKSMKFSKIACRSLSSGIYGRWV